MKATVSTHSEQLLATGHVRHFVAVKLSVCVDICPAFSEGPLGVSIAHLPGGSAACRQMVEFLPPQNVGTGSRTLWEALENV